MDIKRADQAILDLIDLIDDEIHEYENVSDTAFHNPSLREYYESKKRIH